MGAWHKKHIKLMKIEENKWETLEEICYMADDTEIYRVPERFQFDGASIPRFFHRFGTPMGGNYTKSSCLHDWNYKYHPLSRKGCDNLFLECMKAEGVPMYKRYCMFWAVRIGGHWAYKNK